MSNQLLADRTHRQTVSKILLRAWFTIDRTAGYDLRVVMPGHVDRILFELDVIDYRAAISAGSGQQGGSQGYWVFSRGKTCWTEVKNESA